MKELQSMTIKQKIEELFVQWENAQDFSGVISVSNNGKIVFEKIQGFRNRGEQLPNKSDTAFGIASGTKLFTAVAICRLINQGKLTLNSKVLDILPYDLKCIDKNTTIFHLLTHSSGIADYLNDAIDFDDDASVEKFYTKHPVHTWTTNAFYLSLFCELPNKFELGTKASYSNSNFILLGLIIEAITGENYHTYIKHEIIEPLGLSQTGFYATNNLPANTAIGYMLDKLSGELVGNYFYIAIVGCADGGLYTTAKDMALFWRGVFACKLFSQSMLTQFLTPQTVYEDINGHFGLGVFINEDEGKKIYWHSGSDYGASFHTAYIPHTESILTILANVEMNIWSFQSKLDFLGN